jgi:hypothetical protein
MHAGRVVGAGVFLAAFALTRTAAAQAGFQPQPWAANTAAAGAEVGVGFGLLASSGAGSTYSTTRARAPAIGGSIELDAGWLALPQLAVGVWGFGAQLSEAVARPSPADVFEAGAGIQGTLHLRPYATDYDPWLMVGSGWRAQWFSFPHDGVTTEQGMELVRVQAGVDLRASPTLALGPMVGASLSTYVLEATEGGPWHAIPGPRLNGFVVAGVRATLDLPLPTTRAVRPAREAALP